MKQMSARARAARPRNVWLVALVAWVLLDVITWFWLFVPINNPSKGWAFGSAVVAWLLFAMGLTAVIDCVRIWYDEAVLVFDPPLEWAKGWWLSVAALALGFVAGLHWG